MRSPSSSAAPPCSSNGTERSGRFEFQFHPIPAVPGAQPPGLLPAAPPRPERPAAAGQLLLLHVLEPRLRPAHAVLHRRHLRLRPAGGQRGVGQAAALGGPQPPPQPGGAVLLQVLQLRRGPFVRRGPRRGPGPGRAPAGRAPARGHLLLHLPGPGLHHRRLPQGRGGGEELHRLRPVHLLLPPAGGRPHRALRPHPPPAQGVPPLPV